MGNRINSRKVFLLLPILAFFMFFSSKSYAFDPEIANKKHSPEQEKEAPEKFNAGHLIMEHIADAHEWHVAGHLAIPLPVILYSKAKGLDIFLSNKLEEKNCYKGYQLQSKEIVAVNADGSVDERATAGLWDISITKNVAALMISMCLMLLIFITIARSYTNNKDKAPRGLQSFLEPIIIFVRDDIAKSSIGKKKYEKYMPFLLTAFFFILINNLLGLIPIFPGGANLTGNIAITMSLAILTFFITSFSANKNYWRHVIAMPGVPGWVLFLLTPIEILGVFLRPFVLMIRLFANITAGHIIALSFFSLIFIFAEMNVFLGYGVSVLSLAFTVFMNLLELLVAFLQAYVFTLLSAIYFGAAVEDHHHEKPDLEKQMII